MSVPLFSRSNREAVKLALGVGELYSIAHFEEAVFRHMRILGEEAL
jgi:hypothetical protein